MRYPSISKQPRREVNIPELSGGINMRDSVTNILDNQLTDSANMWFKDGALRTRPPFKAVSCLSGKNLTKIGFKAFSDIVDDEDRILMSYAERNDTTQYIHFWWQGTGGATTPKTLSHTTDKELTYFVVDKDGTLYCYLSDASIYSRDYSSSSNVWTAVDESAMYVPTAVTHCKSIEGGMQFTGTQFEGFNMLTSCYKMVYSAYNAADQEHYMRYRLAKLLPVDNVKRTITAELTLSNGTTYTHTVEWGGENKKYFEEKSPGDNLYMFVTCTYVMFSKTQGDSTIYYIPTEEDDLGYDFSHFDIEDNLEITAYRALKSTTKNKMKDKMFGMTRSVWFGGASGGIGGGTRIFLCGNKNKSERALVVWSGLNNPLYFPENNYVYIGNKQSRVTGFGKQDDKLIIFKPNETYYSYYAQNTDITAEDLINQNVVDYQANCVYFPIIQLNGSIGCDCPDTVELCRNRLVWANSDGRVYTLASANQYNEKSVLPVSEMVERRIKAKHTAAQLKAASACDMGGYYVLAVGVTAYVMEYDSYGFQYVYSYTKTEDANLKIPWYSWRSLPTGTDVQYICAGANVWGMHCAGDKLCASVLGSDNPQGTDKYYNSSAETVSAQIISKLTTKLFDFGAPHYRKNVDRVSISFGNNGGIPIRVRFVTDVGTEEESVTLEGGELTPYTAGYVTTKQFNPCIRAARRFGVEMECEGELCVDAVNLLYRLLGGVR